MISEFHLFLERFPLFHDIPPMVRSELERHLKKESFPAHHRVVEEGAMADRLYFILEGTAEVVVGGKEGAMVVASLGPGEMFGEIALLQSGSKRSATILSTSPLTVLTLDGAVFQSSLETAPEARWSFKMAAEDLILYNFLKLASPFRTLHARQLKTLIRRLERRSVREHTVIIYQGQPGEACFLLRSGRVEVVCTKESGDEQVLATLAAGSLFGETALLTDTPRNATVRTIEPCEVLVLHRKDLVSILGEDRLLSGHMIDLLRLRERPKAIDHVTAQHRTTADGEPLVILKNDRNQSYYQLTASGWFIWQQLNGQQTLRDLTLAYFEKFAAFSPHVISETISRLLLAGFLEQGRKVNLSSGNLPKKNPIMEWRFFYRNVDSLLTRLYRSGVHWFYTKTAQILLGLVGVSGLVTFFTHLDAVQKSLAGVFDKNLWFFFLIPAIFIGILLHEAAHAFTVKAFGHEVLGIGLGWHWVSPVFFVDTSDMWMAKKWPRIAVSLAGPYLNFILGGVASWVALFLSDPQWVQASWLYALGSYLVVVVNLTPVMKYDGSHALTDFRSRS